MNQIQQDVLLAGRASDYDLEVIRRRTEHGTYGIGQALYALRCFGLIQLREPGSRFATLTETGKQVFADLYRQEELNVDDHRA